MSNVNGADKRREMVKLFSITEPGYQAGRFGCILKIGQSFEDALHPEFWAPVAGRLCGNKLTGAKDQTGSIIEVRTEDHRFYAELYIRAVYPNSIKVAILREPVMLEPKAAVETSETFKLRWNPGKKIHEVIRDSDKQIIGQGFKVKEDALKFIDEMAA